MAATVVVHPTADLLAAAVAARLVTALVEAQAARGHAHVVLTGGGVGTAALAAVAAEPARDAVDWAAVDVWWGDERFLPTGHPDRNETQARSALLDHVPVQPGRMHPMPASDGRWGDDVDAAALGYVAELAAAADPHDPAGVPAFDVLMLGVGPDAHVASLFPGHPAVHARGPAAVVVRNSPKPPPTRISLTVPSIRRAGEVWLLAGGGSKADAVALALGGAEPAVAPAGAVAGRQRTLWLLDADAAAGLPERTAPGRPG